MGTAGIRDKVHSIVFSTARFMELLLSIPPSEPRAWFQSTVQKMQI